MKKNFKLKKQNNLENKFNNKDEDNSMYMEDEEIDIDIKKKYNKYNKNYLSNRNYSPNNVNVHMTEPLYDVEKAKKKRNK